VFSSTHSVTLHNPWGDTQDHVLESVYPDLDAVSYMVS
jgi:hypothetical protein